MTKYSKLNKECKSALICCKKISKLIKKWKRNKNFEKQNGAGVGLLKKNKNVFSFTTLLRAPYFISW